MQYPEWSDGTETGVVWSSTKYALSLFPGDEEMDDGLLCMVNDGSILELTVDLNSLKLWCRVDSKCSDGTYIPIKKGKYIAAVGFTARDMEFELVSYQQSF